MATNLPNFAEFELTPQESVSARFPKWVQRLERLFAAMDIDNADRKQAMLLHYAGEEVDDIYQTLVLPADADPNQPTTVYDKTVSAFKTYFEPQKNIDHHVYLFRKEVQKSTETVAQFHTRLQLLAKKCEFTDSSLEIKRQIIQGCTSSRLRRKSMESEMTLANLIKTAQAMEISEAQSAELEKRHPQINAIQPQGNTVQKQDRYWKQRKSPQNRSKSRQRQTTETSSSTNQATTTCGLCGGSYPHKGKCPAKGQKCRKCGTPDHFARVCRKTRAGYRQVNTMQEDAPESSEYTFFMGAVDTNSVKTHLLDVEIHNLKVQAIADTGASATIITEKDYIRYEKKPSLEETSLKIYPYLSSTPLHLFGKFSTTVAHRNNRITTDVYVAEGNAVSIISRDASKALQLVAEVASCTSPTPSAGFDEILSDCTPVTTGIGCYKGEPIHITVDPAIPPVAQPHRRIPFHVRAKVEGKLKQLEAEDIIERAEGPTPWVSPIVVVPKPKTDDIRICVDMRRVNKAIIRERHIIPTLDDVVVDLNGCKVFSKLDLTQGYHQMLLDKESRMLTTFSTHVGLWRYKRMNFGISCAAEMFQKKIADVIEGIPGTRNISDDIYIGGKDDIEHDNRLKRVLNRLQEYHLTINPGKCQYRMPQITFFGHIFDARGVSPDPKKVEAVQRAESPESPTEIRSFLSSVAFCSRYIPRFSTIAAPLRKLTCKDTPWLWGEEEEQSFNAVKNALTCEKTLGYFDPKKETVLYVDASPVGVGAVLTQKNDHNEISTLYYASRSLTQTEQRYSQVEREALAVYWAIFRFNLYVYGNSFTVVTDHKPLLPLFNNPASKPPTRIERWIVGLQGYRFTLEYQPGATNPADYPSRHPSVDSGETTENEADHHVAYVAVQAVPKAMTLKQVEDATMTDPVMCAVRHALRTGQWHKAAPAELATYAKVKTELTDTGTVLLKGNKLILPTKLQDKAIDIAHENHQGIVKTKALMREKIWFPLMDTMVENKVKACHACQVVTPHTTREPLNMTILPQGPWQEISVDFASVSGETLLVVMDDYSRYPLVQLVSTTAAAAVIPKLDHMFAMFGVPEIVKSDNGPPFNGKDFAYFAEVMGFKHRKVTPYWPQANGEIERFVKTLKKSVQVAKLETKNWRKELQHFLGAYRTTPHTTTGCTPATLFLRREVKTKLPSLTPTDPVRARVFHRDSEMKNKQKWYADSKRYVTPSSLQEGDSALVKTTFEKKATTPYHPEPFTIIKKKGSMITARNGDRVITRNTSHFKKVRFRGNDTEVIPEIYENPNLMTNHDQPDDQESTVTIPSTEDIPPERVVTEQPLRRSGRERKPPSYLQDYNAK